jgi:methylenetetrahydrofolate reductase (NADPH)
MDGEGPPERARSRLEAVLEAGHLAVTAEVTPPASVTAERVREAARLLAPYADACNVTDCTRASVRMASLAASAILLQEGVEPVMQVVTRDRNRIALQADLLGAHALGVRNLLCLYGDPPHIGDEKGAQTVFELRSEDLVALVKRMRDEGKLLSGGRIQGRPAFFIGAAANPFVGEPEAAFLNLRGKVDAGADFVQTQGVYDVDRFDEWMALVRKEWLHETVPILAGVIPLRSAKAARFMATRVPGVVMPEGVLRRMEEASDPKAEGIRIALETIQGLRKVEGVAGFHIMAVNWEEAVPQIVSGAGLYPRPDMG